MSPEERLNSAREYKATLHNEHVSTEAKQHAEQMLLKLDEEEARHELYEEGEHMPHHRHQRRSHAVEGVRSPHERINAARGYKADFSPGYEAIHNPLVSEEGKKHARKMLQQMDDEEAQRELYNLGERAKNPTRVAAGLKAAQNNPLVTEEVAVERRRSYTIYRI